MTALHAQMHASELESVRAEAETAKATAEAAEQRVVEHAVQTRELRDRLGAADELRALQDQVCSHLMAL